MIALKLINNKVVSCKYPCYDLDELRQKCEGFALYDWSGEEKDIPYLKLENGVVVVDETEKQAALQIKNASLEINQIKAWFTSYDCKASEHARCQRLGIFCHHNMTELDQEAEEKKARLNELKELL